MMAIAEKRFLIMTVKVIGILWTWGRMNNMIADNIICSVEDSDFHMAGYKVRDFSDTELEMIVDEMRKNLCTDAVFHDAIQTVINKRNANAATK
jgi:hypothetical protein